MEPATAPPFTRELELKFEVRPEIVPSLQAELRRHGARVVSMAAHYYDTPDFALAAHSLSLRLRREGRKWVQTLKGEGRSAVERIEHNVPVPAARGALAHLDVDRHNGTQPGSLLRAALGEHGLRGLAERYATTVERLVCGLHIGDSTIEAALDLGTIRADGRSVPICELELEHKAGATGALFELARAWCVFGGLWLSTVSKAARGTRLARGEAYGPPVKAARPDLRPGMSGPQLARAVLRSTLDQVLANASEIAAGSTDEEHVHQVRVGLRRLRTALRELAPLDAHIDAGWEASLAGAFARLGEARDSVTAARAVRPLLEQVHAPKVQWRETATVDPVAIVRAATFQGALVELLGYALQESDDTVAEAAQPEPMEQVRLRLNRLHERVCAAGKCFESMPIEEQHRTRKRLKRLRYVAEFIAPLYASKDVKRYLEHLEPAQDALGGHVDVTVAIDRFRKDAETDPQALFAVGFLEAYLANTARAAHAALKKVAKAQPFWG
ncbi:MAG TPA: CYTH and CHAD domain-containing protein [Burkholderiaceae bacterium]|nr:CYTH and CHAD domain-containing protein [Burkholderiaceae bacterium]